MVPTRHDLVLWQGVKWIVTRVLPRGRLEIALLSDPALRWVCLAEQLQWQGADAAWLLRTEDTQIGDTACED